MAKRFSKTLYFLIHTMTFYLTVLLYDNTYRLSVLNIKPIFAIPLYFKPCLIQGGPLTPKGHFEHSKFSREILTELNNKTH